MGNLPAAQDLVGELDHEHARAWKPQAGERVAGRVVEFGERDGGYGAYPIVTLELEDGTRAAIHAFHTVLAGELARIAPQLGDQIAVKYSGLIATEGGRSRYHAYRVASNRVKRTAVNWAKYADSDTSDTPESDVPIEPVEPVAVPDNGDDPLPF